MKATKCKFFYNFFNLKRSKIINLKLKSTNIIIMLSLKQIDSLIEISKEAGEAIMNIYSTNYDYAIKKDDSPITIADTTSNDIISDSLRSLTPNIPILSEENSDIPYEERYSWETYWLVDPLDGTKEFINQNKDFTVNIALIEKNLPILGVIYAPALSLLYFAEKDLGSYKLMTNKKIISLKGSKKLNSNKKNYSDTIKIIGSRSHPSKELDTWLKKNFKNYEIIKRGSSIKFCEIAEGKADIYPRFGSTSEWDIAAGQVILEQSGGSLKDFNNQKILYNYKESVINPPFIAQCKIFN